MTERLLRRLGHRYILAMMVGTRLFGSIGGVLVVYYVNLTLNLPEQIRHHFDILAVAVVAAAVVLTLLLALAETRNLRPVLRKLLRGEAVDPAQAVQAGREAVRFAAHHHWHEAWLVPTTTLVPVLLFLKVLDDAS